MQLTKLAALLPALALVSASPVPEGLKTMYVDTKLPASDNRVPDNDGYFQIRIEGAEQYKGDLGDNVMGHYWGQADVSDSVNIFRMTPGGVVPQEQTYGVVLALKSKLDTAIIECSLTTTETVPSDAGVVTFDVKDPANPKATAGAGPFKDVKCEKVNRPFEAGHTI